jgi:NADH dehydrogenase
MGNEQSYYSVNIPSSKKPRLVIIGGGFGGINLLRRINSTDFQVVLLDRYNYHTFQPLLYQVATAGLEPDSVAGPLRTIVRKQKGVYFRMLKVHRADPDSKVLETSAGLLPYDYLVVATGAQVNFFNNKSIAENAFPVKQVTHALDLRSHLFQQFEKAEILTDESEKKRLMTFVIVGAGPTGVEICGALAELKNKVLQKDYPQLNMKDMEIYMVEGLDRVLPEMSSEAGKKSQAYLEKMGVNIILNCLIKEYDGKTAKLNNGTEIQTDTLIWGAGVKGNLIEGFSEISIEKGQLMVNEFNQIYKDKKAKIPYDGLFAIGDVAHMKYEGYPKGLPGLAQVAIQQGKQLAKNLDRLQKKEAMKPFRYLDKGVLATIGRNKAVADLPWNIKLSGMIGWFVWMVVHLLFLVGFRNKAVVFANWVWNYFTYDRGIRLILRPSTKKNDTVSREMIEEMHEDKQDQ